MREGDSEYFAFEAKAPNIETMLNFVVLVPLGVRSPCCLKDKYGKVTPIPSRTRNKAAVKTSRPLAAFDTLKSVSVVVAPRIL